MGEHFIPYRIKYEKEDIKKIKHVAELFLQLGGIPFEIMCESGLKKVYTDGMLDDEKWENANLVTQRCVMKIDVYAINSCLNVLKKEQLIRKFLNPEFYVERLDFSSLDEDALPFDNWDDEVLAYLVPGKAGIFLCEKDLKISDYSLEYQKLAYQTAHIMHYYGKELEKIEENIKKISETNGIVGISLGKEKIYTVNMLSDGSFDIQAPAGGVDGLDYPEAHTYSGYGSIWNIGMATSEMAFQIQEIMNSYENKYNFVPQDVTVALPALLHNEEDFEPILEEYRDKNPKSKAKKLQQDLYNVVNLYETSTLGIVEKAVEFAGIQEFNYEPRATAIALAYEQMDEANKLNGNATALVFDWSNDYFSASIVDRSYRNELHIKNQCVIKNPIGNLTEITGVDTFCERLRASMLKQLEPYGIYHDVVDESRWDSWDAFYDQAENVIQQMIRNNYAILRYKDYIFDMTVDYPAEVFLEIFEPYYQQTENIVEKIINEIQFQAGDISRVFLAGEWGNFPYVKQRLEAFFGRYTKVCVMDNTALAAAKGAAIVAKMAKNIEKETDVINELHDMKKEKKMNYKRTLIPTFFELSGIDGECRKEQCEYVYGNLSGIYERDVRDRILQSEKTPNFNCESKFNMYMPTLEIPKKLNHSHTFKAVDESITFEVPEVRGNNYMLYMQLVTKNNVENVEEISQFWNIATEDDEMKVKESLKENKDSLFAKVTFWSKKKTDSNKGRFICLKENYVNMNWEHDKYILVDDQMIGCQYVLKCWIEQLPIPGKDKRDYVYAYVDGADDKNKRLENNEILTGSGYILYDGRAVYVGRSTTYSLGGNAAGEYIAATNTINYVSSIVENIKELHIYYDCTQIGNTGVGIFDPKDKDYVDKYLEALKNFECDIIFEHVDAHSNIFGNEIADRLATVKKEIIGREEICPADGSFSKPLILMEK